MTVSESNIQFTVLNSGVANLELCRPDKRNAFDADMIGQISNVLRQCHAMPALRVLNLSGQGQVFCAGADLDYMRSQATFTRVQNQSDARKLAEMFYLLASLPVPTVAHVQGAAIGGGLGLLACVDYVSAADNCVFATSEVKLGLVPGVISPYVIRKIGMAHAAQIMMSGSKFGCVDALRFGLIQQIDNNSTSSYVQELMSASGQAVRATKALVRQMCPLPTEAQIEFSIAAIADARSSADGREGLASFFEKRKPNWCLP